MSLEDLTGTKYIDSLVATNPASGDPRSEGDDHIRGVKNVLKLSFPNVSGAANPTHTELNYLDITTLGTAQESKAVTADSSRLVKSMRMDEASTWFVDASDVTKSVRIECSGATTGKQMSITSVHTDARTLTLPNATDTLVGKATTDTLTNKTLTSAVLSTGVSGTAVLDEDDMSTDSATQLATQQSIKAYSDMTAESTTATTSGTAVTVASGLSGVRAIDIALRAVSTSSTNFIEIRLGHGAGPTFVNSGYISQTSQEAAESWNSTTGFVIANPNGGTASHTGTIRLVHVGSNVWICSHVVGDQVTPYDTYSGGGELDMSGNSLTAVQITTIAGSDTFTAGSVTVLTHT